MKYDELLSYARRISRTTLPGTWREAEATTTGEDTPKDGNATNGNSTPVAMVNGAEKDSLGTMVENDESKGEGEVEQSQSTALPPQFIPATTLPPTVFTPWPHDVLLRRGALATIQVLVEKGVEIEGYDGEKIQEIEEENKRIAEAGAVVDERRESTVVVPIIQGGSGQGQVQGGQVQKPKKQFELETFEDDDDDDE